MKFLINIAKFSVFSALMSFSAQATYSIYWDVEADAGSYGPLALGDTLTLDACNSTVVSANNLSNTYNICNISDTSNLSVNWYAINNTTNIGQWLTTPVTIGYETFGNVNANEILNFATGGGFFNTVGTYTVGLYIAARNYSNLTLGGVSGNFSGDSANSFSNAVNNNGYLNNGKNYTTFTVNEAVVTPVPEPESLVLLLPALAFIARRQRQKTSKKQLVA